MKKILLFFNILLLGINISAQDDLSITRETISLNTVYQNIASDESYMGSNQFVMQDEDLHNGHNYDYYHKLYKKAVSTEKTGKILMIVGGPTFAAGVLMGIIGFGMGWGGSDNANAVFFPGLGLAVGGFIAFNVGIPFFTSGKIKRRKNKKMMEQGWPYRDPDSKNLTFGATSNGIGFILQL